MTGKIGKWAIILGTIVNSLILVIGILFWYDFLLEIPFESFYYPLLMSMSLVSSLFCVFLGWICVQVTKKETEQAVNENNIAVFFKSYLYVWVVVALFICIFGFMFLDFRITIMSGTILACAIFNGVAWIGTAIVCVLIWAAFNAWKNSELIGVIVALIALIVLIATLTFVGILYKTGEDYAKDYAYPYVHEEYVSEVVVHEVYEEDYDEDYEDGYEGYYEEWDYDSEDRYDLAFRFLKYRLDFEDSSSPIDLLRCWRHYSWEAESGWGEEEYIERRSNFSDVDDFLKSKSSFYSVYDESIADNDKMFPLAALYLKGWDVGVSAYKKSGAQACVKALLWAYDDIYSYSNSVEILEEMYDIMCEEVPEYYIGDEMASYRYPKLAVYMSPQVQEKMEGLSGDCTTWCDQVLLAWAYSFWARRYNDGVDTGAYTVLKIIDKFYD